MLAMLFTALLTAATPGNDALLLPHDTTLRARVAAWRAEREAAIIREFVELLAIPNVASDKENIGRNADAIVAMFAKRGIDARLLRIEGAPPIVVADWKSPSAKETIAFYAHYDGQPVDPAQWATPPWQPVIVRNEGDDRIYARSSGDDKGTIIAMLAAIDRLQAKKRAPSGIIWCWSKTICGCQTLWIRSTAKRFSTWVSMNQSRLLSCPT